MGEFSKNCATEVIKSVVGVQHDFVTVDKLAEVLVSERETNVQENIN